MTMNRIVGAHCNPINILRAKSPSGPNALECLLGMQARVHFKGIGLFRPHAERLLRVRGNLSPHRMRSVAPLCITGIASPSAMPTTLPVKARTPIVVLAASAASGERHGE